MSQDNIKYEEVVVDASVEDDEIQPMSEDEVNVEVARLIRDAVDYVESELSPSREKATDYYMSRPLGDEEEGRSQIVTSEVKDTVDAIMPSMMRVFFGPERLVEFEPKNQEDAPGARQATDYAQYVLTNDNKGVVELHSVFKDAFLKRMGIMKWWWDDATEVEHHSFTGLSEDQLVFLEADPRCEWAVTERYEYTDPAALANYTLAQQEYNDFIEQTGAPPPGAQPPVPPEAVEQFDVEVKYTNPEGRLKVAAVPPEEFIFSSNARCLEDAVLVGQRRDMKASDLIAMGIDKEIVQSHAANLKTATTSGGPRGATSELKSSPEAISRRPGKQVSSPDSTHGANAEIPYYDLFIYLDLNGDGTTQHRHITCIGHTPEVVTNDAAPSRDFALFEIDPEPHTIVGMDLADKTMKLQLLNTKVLRGVLDSLSFSLHPRTEAVEGEVNIADVLNTEIGSVIRTRQPGMVREFTHTFNGQYALPFLEYFGQMKENSVGVSKASAGLNPDALQSSTQAAVAATVSGAQQHLEMYARMLAETGMKDLMRGILRTITANQQSSRKIRLNNEFVEVDPRAWDATMDVTINVAVGYTVNEERIAALKELAGKQWEIITTLGPGNEFVSYGQYAATLNMITKLSGFADTSKHFNQMPLDYNPEPPPPKPSPEEVLAQSQAQKVQSDAQLEAKNLELKELEITLRDQREREKLAAETALKAKDMELKYQVQIESNKIKAAASSKTGE